MIVDLGVPWCIGGEYNMWTCVHFSRVGCRNIHLRESITDGKLNMIMIRCNDALLTIENKKLRGRMSSTMRPNDFSWLTECTVCPLPR